MNNVVKLFTWPERNQARRDCIFGLLDFNRIASGHSLADLNSEKITFQEHASFEDQLCNENIELYKMLHDAGYPIKTKRVVGISNCNLNKLSDALTHKFGSEKVFDDSDRSYHRFAATDDIINEVLSFIIDSADLKAHPTVTYNSGEVEQAGYKIDDLEDTPDLWYL